MFFSLFKQDALKRRQKLIRGLETNDPLVDPFASAGIEKDDAGRAEQAEALQQRDVGAGLSLIHI